MYWCLSLTHATMRELYLTTQGLTQKLRECLLNKYNSISISVPFHHVNTKFSAFHQEYIQNVQTGTYIVSVTSAETSNLRKGQPRH